MPTPSEKDKSLLQTPYSSEFNFHSDYSVVLDHPLSTVFPVLAHGDQLERVARLSDLCTDFELFENDMVALPESKPLIESRMRTQPAADGEGEGRLPRQYFKLAETVPLLFGLEKTKVEIVGAQTWDPNAHVSLYETVTDQGIIVWKLRQFKEFEEGGKKNTSVSENIRGISPGWMKLIVQRETAKGHRCVFV